MPSRRSPAPDQRRRDAERTRAALLDAALADFSAKGFAGARVSEIAARAGVDKQLISYYFGGKEGLYRALVERWLAQEEDFGGADVPLEDLVARYVRDAVEQRDLHRLFLRQSLDDEGDPGGPGEDDLQDMRRRRSEGEIAEDLDPSFLLLILQGAVAAGIAFPADVRRLTGLDPGSPEFAERYAEHLRRVVRKLGLPGP